MIASVKDYAIFMLDPQGRVVSWNPGAERIIGYRADEIVGVDFSRFFVPAEVTAGKPAHELERAAKEGRYEDESLRVRKDGTRFWAHVILSAMHDGAGRLLGFAKITRDLTQSRKTEEERLRLAQAQEAIRLRDEFLSIASHELKTPLTALQLQLQSVHARVRTLDDKLATKLDRATRASDRLADLIETLLDVSRIATGKLSLSLDSFDLEEATRDVVERVRDAANSARSQLTLRSEKPVAGRWDRLRIEQIVMNLLSNAIKYAGGKPIEVTVASYGGAAVVEVRDHGPGLADQDLSRIFGRFERATSANQGGIGLGLYIARQLAEAHGGSLAARNVQGGGASFILRLPLATDPQA
jgi:PAS domain S-box-containing protein